MQSSRAQARLRMRDQMSGQGAATAMVGNAPAPARRANTPTAPNYALQNRQRIRALEALAKAKALEQENTLYLQQQRPSVYTDVKSRVYQPKAPATSIADPRQPQKVPGSQGNRPGLLAHNAQPRVPARTRTPSHMSLPAHTHQAPQPLPHDRQPYTDPYNEPSGDLYGGSSPRLAGQNPGYASDGRVDYYSSIYANHDNGHADNHDRRGPVSARSRQPQDNTVMSAGAGAGERQARGVGRVDNDSRGKSDRWGDEQSAAVRRNTQDTPAHSRATGNCAVATRGYPGRTGSGTTHNRNVGVPSSGATGSGNRVLGKVPLYLQQRKAAWAREEQQRKEEIERERARHALVLMPAEERLATLARLEAKKRMLLDALHRMRLSDDSEAGRRRRCEVDAQLQQVDAMIATMSHEQVYVKPTHAD